MVRKRMFRVTVEGAVYEVEVEEVQGEKEEKEIARPAPVKPAAAEPVTRRQPSPEASGAGTTVSAPLPGLVLDVKAAEGVAVDVGQVLVILEAMKMENEIVAPRAGIVSKVHVTKGTGVAAGDPLVDLS